MEDLEYLSQELQRAFEAVNEAEKELQMAKEYQQKIINDFVNALVSSS
ncbi:MAG: hypothetical protein J6R67_03685 [Treponema sp.]|nr:hypothetical protein [Treponema sp.]